MQIEYEAKFLIDDVVKYSEKLNLVGAVLVHERSLLNRVLLVGHGVDGVSSWLRIRQEFGRVFVTYKKQTDQLRGIDSVQELQLEVSSYQQAIALFTQLGYQVTKRVENYRSVWRFQECDITIDEWPGLPIVSEIEGPSEKAVHSAALPLGLPITDALYCPFWHLYESLYTLSPAQVEQLSVVSFATITQDILKIKGS